MTDSYFRQSMDGSIYRRSDAGTWEMQAADGTWAPLPVPLSAQDYDHLREITPEEALANPPVEAP